MFPSKTILVQWLFMSEIRSSESLCLVIQSEATTDKSQKTKNKTLPTAVVTGHLYTVFVLKGWPELTLEHAFSLQKIWIDLWLFLTKSYLSMCGTKTDLSGVPLCSLGQCWSWSMTFWNVGRFYRALFLLLLSQHQHDHIQKPCWNMLMLHPIPYTWSSQ